MADEVECDFARSGPVTEAGPADSGPSRTLRRTALRASDGVRIDAAYEPFAGSGNAGAADRLPGAIVLAHGFSGSVDRPAMRRAVQVFAQYGAVITFSFRGHGSSGGHSTVGDREVLDLAAAVRWARSMGHAHVATVGFSMGGSVVVRHGALYPLPAPDAREGRRTVVHPGTAASPSATAHTAWEAPALGDPALAVPDTAQPHSEHSDIFVSVSAPARWYYRGTAPMRRLHWVIQRPVGRVISRYGLRTRIHPHDWDPVPLSPVAAAPSLAPRPLLVVHGDQDAYFPLDHPRSLAEAADPDCTELWEVPGFGHAENAAEPQLLHRIGAWITAEWPKAPHSPA
ncbi:MAG TPA: alpha/beta fold hydrolase [Streptomyces sp.]|nr:alpha/beta fold hydrolase [Streptomyces sp.]